MTDRDDVKTFEWRLPDGAPIVIKLKTGQPAEAPAEPETSGDTE
jgi:hypothetical protein